MNKAQLGNRTASHLQLLGQVLGSPKRAQGSLIYSYKHAFNGFAALLTEDHANTLAAKLEDVSILPSETSQLFTTNSWNFLSLSIQESITFGSTNPVIIGVIDSGISPLPQFFKEDQLGPIPARWKGKCDGGTGFLSTYCNRKLVGVRYYNAGWIATNGRLPNEDASALDVNGHGTHVVTTAGGGMVDNVQVLNGLIQGTVRGGSPLARLAVYKVFWEGSCSDADLLAAIDDAIDDGVDIINLSLGNSPPESNYLNNPLAIASFHAMRRGILSVFAAGNVGPLPFTIVNTAPWALTVAATTTNRDIFTPIRLGNDVPLMGFSMGFLDEDSPWYELVNGEDIPASGWIVPDDARHCRLNSLDPVRAAGRIVFCRQAQDVINEPSILDKSQYLRQIAAGGMIIVDDTKLSSAPSIRFSSAPLFTPFSIVSSLVGLQIFAYIRTAGQSSARILKTQAEFNAQFAPSVAGFSSRGPNFITQNLLKPDISAPGVTILAGYTNSGLADHTLYDDYAIMSGTSMAAPHVSGAAALLKSNKGFTNPLWSPAALKSALMTTALSVNNYNQQMQTDAGAQANPLDYGAGILHAPLSAVLEPGLIYDVSLEDYIKFLCYMGYSESQISSVFLDPQDKFEQCPSPSGPQLISQINLPSIAVAELPVGSPISIQRTVTNVGAAQSSTYTAAIVQPPGVSVTVNPTSLEFSASQPTQTYHLTLSSSLPGGSVFGSITWSDGTHNVRSPIAIHSTIVRSTLRMLELDIFGTRDLVEDERIHDEL